MAMMSSNLLRSRKTIMAGHVAKIHQPTPLEPLPKPKLIGSVKNFFSTMCYKVLGSPRPNTESSQPIIPSGIPTTESNDFIWSVWKWIFMVSSTSFAICLVHVPFFALFHPFPLSYLTLGAGLELISALLMNTLLSREETTVSCVDNWMWFLGLDFYVGLRVLKLFIINVFYSLGYEDFSVVVVYASSLYSISSIAVCKMSGSRSPHSKTTTGDFITVLFTPFYNRIVKQKNYLEAVVYGVPIVLAFLSRATEQIFPPVNAASTEAQSEVFGGDDADEEEGAVNGASTEAQSEVFGGADWMA